MDLNESIKTSLIFVLFAIIILVTIGIITYCKKLPWISNGGSEGFDTNKIYKFNQEYVTKFNHAYKIPSRHNQSHVRIDRLDRIQGFSEHPPIPQNNEIDCIIVNCPPMFPSSATCYKCE
jgi:hypothetical protein